MASIIVPDHCNLNKSHLTCFVFYIYRPILIYRWKYRKHQIVERKGYTNSTNCTDNLQVQMMHHTDFVMSHDPKWPVCLVSFEFLGILNDVFLIKELK